MDIKIPKIVADYLKAANSGDTEKASLCFSSDATVLDEGETIVGRKLIQDWMNKTRAKYNHQTEPISFVQNGNTGLMSANVRGNFPGSPIVLNYQMKFNSDLIADLRVVQPK